MKKYLISITFISLALVAFGQPDKVKTTKDDKQKAEFAPTANCYEKWEGMLSARGAERVEDGTHNNVVITVRNGVYADCYVGKCTVSKGIVEHIYAMVEGGGYEIFLRKYQHNTPMTVYNGVSKTRITVDDELVNVLFVENIKEKQRALVRAPEPQLE